MVEIHGIAWLTNGKTVLKVKWSGQRKPEKISYRLDLNGLVDTSNIIGISPSGDHLLYRTSYSNPPGKIKLAVHALEKQAPIRIVDLDRILLTTAAWSSGGRYVALAYNDGWQNSARQMIYDVFREREYPLDTNWRMTCLRDRPEGGCTLLACRALEAGRESVRNASSRFLWIQIDKMGKVSRREGTATEMKGLLGAAYPAAVAGAFEQRTDFLFYRLLPRQFLLSQSGKSALIQGIHFPKGPTWVQNMMPKDKLMYQVFSQGRLWERKVFPNAFITFHCWLKDDRHLVGQRGIELNPGYPEDGYEYGDLAVAEARTGNVVYTYHLPANYRLLSFYEAG